MIHIGDFIADRYEVLDKVGAGGMSDVYKAKDMILGREVAVKVLKAEFADDASFVAKFRTEAQSAAGLEHPNIVNIYDVGSENGVYFIVMEYVEGITLKTYIEKKGQLNFKEAISIAIQVGRGIEAAHAKGIIHRDIKPQNIIISTEGKVKVTDFGIARAATSNTIHADVMGSVHYSSPEQARNGFVDGKSDIYSLGIVMYEMVTGRVPFDGDSTVAIAIQHLQEEMVAPSAYAPDLPVALEGIIKKATMKSPDRRYATITDLLMDLKKALVSPNEVIAVITESGIEKTRVISQVEQEQLNRKAAETLSQDTSVLNTKKIKDEEFDDYDDEYDDDYDDEDDVDPKMERIFTILGIGAGIIIIAIIVGLLGSIFGLFHFGDSKNSVTMIDVVGKEESVAIESLEEIGLEEDNIVIFYEEAEDDEVGIVLEQSVEPDKKFKLDNKIELTVGKEIGEDDEEESEKEEEDEEKKEEDDKKKDDSKDSVEDVEVPDVVGNTEESAIKALGDLGLSYNRTFQYDKSAKSGQVISQSPKAGTKVKPGEKITIVISQGEASVTVPDVTGQTLEAAVKAMNDAGLNVTSTTQDFSAVIPAGSIISQSIAGGKVVDAGTNITLVVSKGMASVVYKFSFSNPYEWAITYTLSTGQSGTLQPGQTGNFQLADVDKCTVTFTYTKSDTNETVTESQELLGTPIS